MDELSCRKCGQGDDEDSLMLCRNFLKCRQALHMACGDHYSVPMGGYMCDSCVGAEQGRQAQKRDRGEAADVDVESGERPYKRLRPVTNAVLLEFASAIMSKERKRIDEGLGMLKDNIHALPPKHVYLKMDEDEQKAVEERSLVFAWLQKSPGCKEIFGELKDVYSTSAAFVLLIEVVHLLMSNNFYLKTLKSNVVLAKRVVQSEVPKMNQLFETNRKGPTMASLMLLRTVASSSLGAATDLLAVVNRASLNELMFRSAFGSDTFVRPDFNYENADDMPDDLRAFACKVVYALLGSADSRLKETLLTHGPETRFVHNAFASLSSQNSATIGEGLACLRNKIIKDRFISRNVKTRFFSRTILTELGLLVHRYHHEGAVKFIRYILSSHHEGIVFPEEPWAPDRRSNDPDEDLGGNDIGGDDGDDNSASVNRLAASASASSTALRQSSNARILVLLEKLCPWRSPVEKNLAMFILRVCPRIAPLYFRLDAASPSRFASLLFPRKNLASWMCGMSFVKLYLLDQPVSPPGPWTSDERALELADATVPPLPTIPQWRKALASSVGLVKLVTLDALCAALTRCLQLEKSNPLCRSALGIIQKSRLPHTDLIQELIVNEKQHGQHLLLPASQMIIAAGLRALNLFMRVFPPGSVQLGAMWSGTLSIGWCQYSAIEQMGAASQQWWLKDNLPAAKEIFAMLARRGHEDALKSAVDAKPSGLKKWFQVCVSDIVYDAPDQAVIDVLSEFGKVEQFERRTRAGVAFVDFSEPDVASVAVKESRARSLWVSEGQEKRAISIEFHKRTGLEDAVALRHETAPENRTMRKQVLASTMAMLDKTELFTSGSQEQEARHWLDAIDHVKHANILIGCISMHLACIPSLPATTAILRAHPELLTSVSPVFQQVCDKAMRGSDDTSGVEYLARLIFELLHHTPLRADAVLMVLKDIESAIPSNFKVASSAAAALAVLQEPLALCSLFSNGACNSKLLGLPKHWWKDQSFLELESMTPHQLLFYFVGDSKSSLRSALERKIFEGIDERLCSQAVCYIEVLGEKMPNHAALSVCLRLLWTGLEGREFSRKSLVSRMLKSRAFVEQCLAAASDSMGVLCLGEALSETTTHSAQIADVLLQSPHLERAAVLLRLLDWSLVDGNLLSATMLRCVQLKNWRLTNAIARATWPGVNSMESWVDTFYDSAHIGPVDPGSALIADLSHDVISTCVESLRESHELQYVVLFWTLLGFSALPSAAVIKGMCMQTSPTSTDDTRPVYSALLAVWSLTLPECASLVASLWDAAPAKASLVPAMLSSKARDLHLLKPLLPTLIAECVDGSGSCAWLDKLVEAVDGGEDEATRAAVSRHFSENGPLAKSSRFVALSGISVERKLRLLLPLLEQSDPAPTVTLWQMVGACVLTLDHIAEWKTDDAPVKLLQTVFEYPQEAAFDMLCSVVRNEKANAGWIERSCREILQLWDVKCFSRNADVARTLLVMVERRPNLCTTEFFGRILSIYQASCSLLDRTLLLIIRFCQQQGQTLESVGGLWGSSENFGAGGTEVAFNEGKIINGDRVMASLGDFVIFRDGGVTTVEDEAAISEGRKWGTVYDPAFLLPYLQFALQRFSPDPKSFLERGFLAYAFMGCSCESETLRAQAYGVLQSYWAIVSEPLTIFKWKVQAKILLSAFKNAILRPFQFVPTVVALFLAKFSILITTPEHFMYIAVNDALLQSPVFDLLSIPLVFKCFLTKTQDRMRRWFFETLSQGLKRPVDLRVAQSVHVFELLQSFFDHIADTDERHLVLTIMMRATRNPALARTVDSKFGVLGWLSANLDSLRERGHAAHIASNIIEAWAENEGSSFETRQLGWVIGMKLLPHANKDSLGDSVMKLLGKCEGASCSEQDVLDIIDRSKQGHVDRASVCLAIAASNPVRFSSNGHLIIRALEMLSLSGGALDDALATQLIRWLNRALARAGNVLTPAARVLLRRIIAMALIANHASLIRELSVFVCLWARVSKSISPDLSPRFVALLKEAEEPRKQPALLHMGALLLGDQVSTTALEKLLPK